jgi:hypothetical protein
MERRRYDTAHILSRHRRRPSTGRPDRARQQLQLRQAEQASWVYLTGTLDAAVWGAELAAGNGRGRIYVVEELLCEPDSRLRRSGSAARSRTIPI